MNYAIHLFIIIGIYAIFALSLQLTVGYTGLMNFGHVAFFGIGAYTSALLTLRGVPYPIALLAAGVCAAIAGWVLMRCVRRLRGDYLALMTLGFHFVLISILLNWTGLTRGPLGIPGIPKPSFFGFVIQSNEAYAIFVTICAVSVYGVCIAIERSRYGKLLEGIRDNELYLASIGKNTARLKTTSMVMSACIAGVAGSLFAHYITFIDPYSFSMQETILIFTIIIFGGVASFRGTVEATFLIILIPEILRFFALPASILGPMRQMIYALILLGMLLFFPKGIRGRLVFHHE